MYKRMWIFVEGEHDSVFAKGALLPILKKGYDFVDTWQYAQEAPKKVIDFLRAMKPMQADCLFLADIDDSPCVTAKNSVLMERFREALEPSDVVVVVKEIESWYLAGADDEVCRALRIASLSRTDHTTKEQFQAMMPERFKDSVVDFMREVLGRFRLDIARSKNQSFCYLMDKLEARLKEA